MLTNMLSRGTRQFSNKVVKYSGKNVNVTKYNTELRTDIAGTVSFNNTWNMGYEGFSSSMALPKMDPVFGNRREFAFLAVLVPTILMLKSCRQKNEDGIRSTLGNATNRYAPFAKVGPSEL